MSITTVGARALGAPGHRAEKRELCLFLATEHVRVETVVGAYAFGKGIAVAGLPHGGGEDRKVRLAAIVVDLSAIRGKGAEHPLARGLREAPRRVHAGPQARYLRAPEELPEHAPGGLCLGDQQARRVRSDVDHRHTHQPGC